MKNKYLLTVKFALASILLGAIGLVLAPPAEPVGAASTVLTVEVEAGIDFEVEKPTSSQKSSQVIPIYTKGLNVSTVDVYVDLNKDGIFDPSEALGVFTVNSSGSYGPAYLGSVKLPDGTAYGEYTMQFVAHPLMNSASLGDVTVTRKIIYAKDAPRIISINPNYGPNTGGTEVTITGEYLEGTTKVEFDGKECKIVSTSATAVICITPSHVSGKVDVVLFSPDGNAVLKDGFLYFAEKSVIPNVPSTGLFRLGDKVVMSSDVLILSIIFLIIGVTLVFIVGDAKKKTRATAGFSVKSGKRAVAAKRKTTTSRKAPVSAKRKAAPKKRK